MKRGIGDGWYTMADHGLGGLMTYENLKRIENG